MALDTAPVKAVPRSPPRFKLLWWVWFRIIAALATTGVFLTRRSCRIEVDGATDTKAPVIYCIWHGDLFAYFVAFWGAHQLVWMGSPSWKITHLRLSLLWVGVKKWVSGTTGDGGIAAASEIIKLIGQGFSTLMTPDGPSGPAKTLRKGVLHMATRSGRPIVALRFEAPARWVARGQWDRKWIPRPFSRMRVTMQPPLYVGESDDLDEAARRLAELMG